MSVLRAAGATVWFADAELDGQFTRTLMTVYAGACDCWTGLPPVPASTCAASSWRAGRSPATWPRGPPLCGAGVGARPLAWRLADAAPRLSSPQISQAHPPHTTVLHGARLLAASLSSSRPPRLGRSLRSRRMRSAPPILDPAATRPELAPIDEDGADQDTGLGPAGRCRRVQVPVHPWLAITRWTPTLDWLVMTCTPTPLGRAEGWMVMTIGGRGPGSAGSPTTFPSSSP